MGLFDQDDYNLLSSLTGGQPPRMALGAEPPPPGPPSPYARIGAAGPPPSMSPMGGPTPSRGAQDLAEIAPGVQTIYPENFSQREHAQVQGPWTFNRPTVSPVGIPSPGPVPFDENDMQRQGALSRPPAMPPGGPAGGPPAPALPPGGGIGSDAAGAPGQPGLSPGVFGSGGIGSDAARAPGQPMMPPPAAPMPPQLPRAARPPDATPAASMPIRPPSMMPQQPSSMDRIRGMFGDMPGALSPEDRARGRFMSSLGAGLKSVGENWNKPGLAAAAGSAGAAIEGGQKRQDIQEAQGDKRLDTALKAMQIGNQQEYRKNLIDYYNEKLKNTGMNNKQKSVLWDNPSWRYLLMQRQITTDVDVERKKQAVNKDMSPAKLAEANAKLDAFRKQKEEEYSRVLQLSPQDLALQKTNPLGSAGNPHSPPAEGYFKQMKPGDHYVNPADPTWPNGKPKLYIYDPDKKKPEVRAAAEPEPGDANHPLNQAAEEAA